MSDFERAVFIETIKRLADKRDTATDGKVRWWYDRLIAELLKELQA